jgi:hypothetical protein
MSFLKDDSPKIDTTTWLENIVSDWSDGPLAVNIIQNCNKTQFKNHINAGNNWMWFRVLMLSKVTFQLEWLEEIVKTGLPIDRSWVKMDTGQEITIFDINDSIEGGFEEKTKNLISDIFIIYEALFLKKPVQTVIDIITDYCEEQRWSELTIILMSHVYGPLNKIYPLFHYTVLLERYDILRALLTAATTLHKVIHKKHETINFQKSWVNLRGNDGGSILHLICEKNKPTWISYFLSIDANPLLTDFNGSTPFHVNTSQNKITILYNTLDVNEQDNWKLKYMHYFMLYAIQKNDPTLLNWLLEKGGDPNTEDLVLICLKNEYNKCLKVLLDFGADPNFINTSNITLKESEEHIEGGGILFYNDINMLLHEKYNPIELCIISLTYKIDANEHRIKPILIKYINALEDKQTILEFFNAIMNIKSITTITSQIQSMVENVIHMCE